MPTLRTGAMLRRMYRWLICLYSSLLLASCATTVGSKDPSTLPENATETCASQCEALGLELDAVAIGDRHVNCVCEPAED